ncbi:MAG TPA: cupin domain-containing protein [Gemmatimonadales bacterium]|nr:cupin domain-containing protein [Gemmatimonadales bacterium]
MRAPYLSLLAVLLLPAPVVAQDSTRHHTGHQAAMAHDASSGTTVPTHAVKWGPAPAAFPAGAQMAVVRGNPAESGPFAVQVSFPDGYKVAPHYHPTAETVAVMRGTLLVGMGDTFDTATAKPLAAGEHATMKAGEHHFAAAKGKTLIEISGMGPMAITYVNPQDDPRGAARP